MKKIASSIVLLLILSIIFVSFPQIEAAKAQATTYIRDDGTVEGTSKIEQTGDLYSFTDNIDGTVVVERDNITIDGAGYTLIRCQQTVDMESNCIIDMALLSRTLC
jgi:hypothetical protein